LLLHPVRRVVITDIGTGIGCECVLCIIVDWIKLLANDYCVRVDAYSHDENWTKRFKKREKNKELLLLLLLSSSTMIEVSHEYVEMNRSSKWKKKAGEKTAAKDPVDRVRLAHRHDHVLICDLTTVQSAAAGQLPNRTEAHDIVSRPHRLMLQIDIFQFKKFDILIVYVNFQNIASLFTKEKNKNAQLLQSTISSITIIKPMFTKLMSKAVAVDNFVTQHQQRARTLRHFNRSKYWNGSFLPIIR
jgi:hypothetical protein